MAPSKEVSGAPPLSTSAAGSKIESQVLESRSTKMEISMKEVGTLWVLDTKKNLRRRYTGDFVDDKKEGRGTMFFPNEDRYDGFWKNN
jgi:hypothetical protein